MLIAEVAIKYTRGGARVKAEVTRKSLTSTVASPLQGVRQGSAARGARLRRT
jgi:hypothetical protein